LADLVRLCLAPNLLQVDELRDLGVSEEVMTAGNTIQAKPVGLKSRNATF
jgi:hypothetical protein